MDLNLQRVLIVGSKGMLGSELVKQAKKNKTLKIFTSDISDENGIDITNESSVEIRIEEFQPDVLINCAAYTNVDGAEDEGAKINIAVNAEGPRILAEKCFKKNIDFVHVSSDYVFGDEKQDGYKEDYSKFNPLNAYGKAKLLGDKNIIDVFGGITKGSNFMYKTPNAYIVRTSWLFGKGATNFISKIIEYGKERDYLDVVTDEISSPTYVKDLAEALLYLVTEKPTGGIYHFSGKGKASRYKFAKKIIETAEIDTEVRKTTNDQFPRKTKIANISYLINTKFPKQRDWEDMVEDFISNEAIL